MWFLSFRGYFPITFRSDHSCYVAGVIWSLGLFVFEERQSLFDESICLIHLVYRVVKHAGCKLVKAMSEFVELLCVMPVVVEHM